MFFFISIFIFSFHSCSKNHVDKKWLNRLIPLPQKISINGSALIPADQIQLKLPETEHPVFITINDILAPVSGSGEGATFAISFMYASSDECPAPLRKVLEELPNSDQAYTIETHLEDGVFTGLTVFGNSPVGLLYGARTLAQLIGKASGENKIEIPKVSIVDWPDLAERGEWGWNLPNDKESISELKMNHIEFHSDLGFNADGSPKASINLETLEQAKKIGVNIVPIIRHMEQLAKTGLFEFHPDVAATPEPGLPLPTDYQPGVCFSNAKTITLLAGWMRGLLEIDGINEINAWLSETEPGCYCSECAGKEPFALEAAGIVKAFELVQKDFPEAHLRILMSQASYPKNDVVLASVSPQTRMVYYDGGKTYDSSHKPMIYPLLEDFAQSGGWLGVYPQLTASWRTIFPFTGPQFMRARMNEFVDKGLKNFSGYATPANCYYEFNIAAAAEWGWNSKGRGVTEFAEAYATRAGFSDPAKFAEWAEIIGNVGWNLAGSRVVQSLIFANGGTVFIDGIISEGDLFGDFSDIDFGKQLFTEFKNEKHLTQNIELAKKALSIAQASDNPQMFHESDAVLQTLFLLEAILHFKEANALSDSNEKVQAIQTSLEKMDDAARAISVSIHKWGALVNPNPRKRFQSRFRDTVGFGQATADILRQRVKVLNIPDKFSEYRETRFMEWTSDDFSKVDRITLSKEVTNLLKSPGEYDVTFRFADGKFGLKTHAVTLLRGENIYTAEPVIEDCWDFQVGRYSRFVDYWLTIPDDVFSNENEKLFIQVEVAGPPMDAPAEHRTCEGFITMKKSWRGEQ